MNCSVSKWGWSVDEIVLCPSVCRFLWGMNRDWVRIRKRRIIENRIHSSDTWICTFRGGVESLWNGCQLICTTSSSSLLVWWRVCECIAIESESSFRIRGFHSTCQPPSQFHLIPFPIPLFTVHVLLLPESHMANAHESSIFFSSSSLIIIVTTPTSYTHFYLNWIGIVLFPSYIQPQCELFSWLMGRLTSHVLIEAEGSLKEQ